MNYLLFEKCYNMSIINEERESKRVIILLQLYEKEHQPNLHRGIMNARTGPNIYPTNKFRKISEPLQFLS